MQKLEILKPKTLGEAVGFLAELGDEAKVLGGGTALVLMYTHGLIAPRYMVSLDRIPDLNYIRHESGNGLSIGAMTPHRTIERSSVVREKFPILVDVFSKVANVRIRNQATVGGVLAEADYASDPPAILVALNAEVHVVGNRGKRRIPIDRFFKGLYDTTLEADEIITEVSIPDIAYNTGAAYIKYNTRSSVDRPCVGVAVVIQHKKGVCDDLRVVIGAVAPMPQELRKVEQVARGQKLTDSIVQELARCYAEGIEPISDIRGSDWYRKQIIEVLVRRAIQQALGANK